MLGRHELAARLTGDAAESYPVMKNDLQNYTSSDTPEEKWHTALFTVLHFPGARPYVNARSSRGTPIQKIDSYRDNWWCEDLGSYSDQISYVKDSRSQGEFKERHDAPQYPAYLSADQVSAAKSEWKSLFTSGSAADYLPQQTVKWARESPNDPRIPEALHFAVRATRYGCDGDRTSRLSREAFKLLHSRYPNSKWAKETPLWF
jgi:hypothetical protein